MAVQSDTSRISYAGNNSTSTSYAVPFVFLENAHLKAIAKTSAGVETVVTLTNHTGAGNVNGGTVRTSVAIPATSTLTIYRDVPITQTTTYAEGGDFPAASHERALDKLTTITQQLDRRINTCIRGSEATPLAPLPSPTGTQQFVLTASANQPPSWQEQPALAVGPVVATGSTQARFITDRFAEVVNVKDFGAVGDGVTDDRAAFVAAANAAASGAKKLLIPSGSYYVSGALINANGVYVESYGNVTGPSVFVGDGGCPFTGDNMYWSNQSNSSRNTLHFKNWNVNATDRNNHLSLNIAQRYDGVANTSSYYGTGTTYSYLHYGQGRQGLGQRASGSNSAIAAHVNVFSADNGTGTGRTEIQGMAAAVTCSPTASIGSACNYYNEISINGPTGTSASDPQREAFMAGACILMQKYCEGTSKDASHEGSYGITITTRAGSGGFDVSRPSNVQNYTLNAGIAINGWTGTAGVHTDGISSGAGLAFEWGIIVGGAGSVWTAHNSRSKIGTGVGISDFVNWGLDIFDLHPSAPFGAGAIRVRDTAGVSLFGLNSTSDIDSRIQGRTSSQFGTALRLWESSHATSERAAITAGEWIFGQDGQGDGTKDFFVYQAGTAQAGRFGITTSGNVVVGSVTPISKLHVDGDLTLSSATTASSATAGASGGVPAQVAGYLVVSINGTSRKIPYYAT